MLLALSTHCIGCKRDVQAPTATADRPSAVMQDNDAARASAALERGIEWLMKQQAVDGGWHSVTYGQMSGGVGNTALVVYAVAKLPPAMRSEYQPQFDRAVRFVLANLDAAEPEAKHNAADYPTYAAALLLSALTHTASEGWTQERSKLRDALQKSQQRAGRGWARDELGFGGWNQTGGGAGDAKRSGNTNISVTCFALEALRADDASHQAAVADALVFLGRCQNLSPDGMGDGGFFFTPGVDDPLNKAGLLERAGKPPTARSYGTTTADGLCALVACGLPRDDSRIRAAQKWLEAHESIELVPGFPHGDPETAAAGEGLQFYYYAALARAIHQFPDSAIAGRKSALLKTLVEQQRADGSWRNSNTLMREDDPLVATALAVTALALLTYQ
jgi:squalene-hopene/tetraprenyl-beta-curcumene cyclase